MLTKTDDFVKTLKTRHEDFIFVLSRIEIRKLQMIWGLGVCVGCHTQCLLKKKQPSSVVGSVARTHFEIESWTRMARPFTKETPNEIWCSIMDRKWARFGVTFETLESH